MKSPHSSLLLAVALIPMAVSFSSCRTIYSDMYSYRKNYFDPYESRDAEKRQLEDAKRQAESARMAALRDAQSQADKLDASAGGALQLDSGLGSSPSSSGLGGSSTIPGLGSSPSSGAPSMGAIPGLDPAPAMGGGAPSMGGAAPAMGGDPAMGGAPAAPATPPKPPAPLPGL